MRSTDGSKIPLYILAVNLATKESSKSTRATTWKLQRGSLTRVSIIHSSIFKRFDIDTDTDVLPLAMDLEISDYYDANNGEVILRK